ncbi:MAG: dihydrodipicolinate synthase family protein, partial [Pirellula sp.]
TDYSQRIQSSVIAVPPLARTSHYAVCEQENRRLIEHLKSGGIRTFLYGGNALFYHIRLSEYAQVVHQVVELAGPDSWVIPSIGSSFGMMMDQAAIAADLPVDTVMVLPQKDITDVGGIERGIRLAVDRMGKPVVLYLKFDRWLPPDAVERLVKAGCVSWIKYAVVLPDPNKDPYLRELLERIPSELFVSGMGEQPAICHMRDFKMGGFTSGCVCVRPDLSTLMLQAIQAGDWQKAEAIREIFEPLEDQRNSISPIRVLHDAVRTSGISEVGPLLPLMSGLDEAQLGGLVQVVETLRGASLR